jgi:hypothetical protein
MKSIQTFDLESMITEAAAAPRQEVSELPVIDEADIVAVYLKGRNGRLADRVRLLVKNKEDYRICYSDGSKYSLIMKSDVIDGRYEELCAVDDASSLPEVLKNRCYNYYLVEDDARAKKLLGKFFDK